MKIILLIFGGVAVTLLLISWLIYQNRLEFIGDSLTAEGLVTGFERRASSVTSTSMSNRYISVPVVEFQTHAGRRVSFVEAAAGVGNDELRKGDQVAVLYDPEKPGRATIYSFFHLWGGALVVFILAAVFSLVFAILLLITLHQAYHRLRLQRHGD
jgi:hypothetical protein